MHQKTRKSSIYSVCSSETLSHHPTSVISWSKEDVVASRITETMIHEFLWHRLVPTTCDVKEQKSRKQRNYSLQRD